MATCTVSSLKNDLLAVKFFLEMDPKEAIAKEFEDEKMKMTSHFFLIYVAIQYVLHRHLSEKPTTGDNKEGRECLLYVPSAMCQS